MLHLNSINFPLTEKLDINQLVATLQKPHNVDSVTIEKTLLCFKEITRSICPSNSENLKQSLTILHNYIDAGIFKYFETRLQQIFSHWLEKRKEQQVVFQATAAQQDFIFGILHTIYTINSYWVADCDVFYNTIISEMDGLQDVLLAIITSLGGVSSGLPSRLRICSIMAMSYVLLDSQKRRLLKCFKIDGNYQIKTPYLQKMTTSMNLSKKLVTIHEYNSVENNIDDGNAEVNQYVDSFIYQEFIENIRIANRTPNKTCFSGFSLCELVRAFSRWTVSSWTPLIYEISLCAKGDDDLFSIVESSLVLKNENSRLLSDNFKKIQDGSNISPIKSNNFARSFTSAADLVTEWIQKTDNNSASTNVKTVILHSAVELEWLRLLWLMLLDDTCERILKNRYPDMISQLENVMDLSLEDGICKSFESLSLNVELNDYELNLLSFFKNRKQAYTEGCIVLLQQQFQTEHSVFVGVGRDSEIIKENITRLIDCHKNDSMIVLFNLELIDFNSSGLGHFPTSDPLLYSKNHIHQFVISDHDFYTESIKATTTAIIVLKNHNSKKLATVENENFDDMLNRIEKFSVLINIRHFKNIHTVVYPNEREKIKNFNWYDALEIVLNPLKVNMSFELQESFELDGGGGPKLDKDDDFSLVDGFMPNTQIKQRFLPLETIRQSSCPVKYTLISGSSIKNASLDTTKNDDDSFECFSDTKLKKPGILKLNPNMPHSHYKSVHVIK